MNCSRLGEMLRLVVGSPYGANGPMYMLNSPDQSFSRSPPVLPIRTSTPAPPNTKSSYDGFVSVRSLRLLFVSSSSSALATSSPQPLNMRSRPVPPTSQSFWRSPKITSLPSVGTPVYVEPRIQWVSTGPSV